MAVRKFNLLTVEVEKAASGKYERKPGAKYKEVSKLVELDIKKGKRAGSKFIITEVPKDTDRATVDQYVVNNYRGQVTGTNRPDYVLTFQAAGTAPQDSALICTLFKKKYASGGESYQGRSGSIRFLLSELDADGNSIALKGMPKKA